MVVSMWNPFAKPFHEDTNETPYVKPDDFTADPAARPAAFITGGASGIGKATAQRLLNLGWTVGAYDIQEATWGTADIPDGQLVTGHLDVTDREEWDTALADFTAYTGGRLDFLFNNAGIIIDGLLTEQDPEKIRTLVDINCLGVTFGAQAAHPYLKATKDAVMINMSSASAIFGQPEISTYSATKFYVNGITEALSVEWRNDDIRVHDLMPLWAATQVANVKAQSVKTMGVNLTPGDVADEAVRVLTTKAPWSRWVPHYAVSLTDRVLKWLRKPFPDPIAQLLMRFVATW